MQVQPFEISIPDNELTQLRKRLEWTRWPDAMPDANWEDGTDLACLRRLVRYWQDGFDWRAQEAKLNEFPQFTAEIDGLNVHFIHQRGIGPRPYPLVATHGAPGTVFDMRKLIPLLVDPSAYGGDPADAFDVVAPSIPGHGFSQAPSEPGVGPARVAELWHKLMLGLGYERFGAQGCDWGSAVSMWLARNHPDTVTGLHVSAVPGRFRPPLGDGQPPLTDTEKAFQGHQAEWFKAEGAYHALQSTKPQTPAYALNDSPAGLAAWILEKKVCWSDSDRDVEKVFTPDELLTNISIYWHTQSWSSAMRFYREDGARPTTFDAGERVIPPFGLVYTPKERDVTPPRSWLERVFDVTRWTELPRGKHFAAEEVPEVLAEEIRAFYRPLRTRTT